MQNWWRDLPSFSRFLFYTLGVTYALSWPMGDSLFYLVNAPAATVLSLQLWRLFTAPFICLGLVPLLLQLISFGGITARRERELGTSRYLVLFLLNAVTVELAYALVNVLISYNGLDWLIGRKFSAGIWPMIMIEIVLRCNMHPEATTQLLLCPLEMKSKYYPWLFVAVFSLSGVVVDLICGILVGYLRKE